MLTNIGSGTGDEEAFFEQAQKLLSAKTIPTLRIGDENTLGLLGDDEDRKMAFFRLLRGQGYSKMEGAGGGTYGIGQRAPFAHSSLRTVFYGSRLGNGSELFIAKNILASFPDPQNGGQLSQSKGWWCEVTNPSSGKWRTIRETSKIPDRFRRQEVGTDLWVTGYLQPDWERSVRHSVLEHFFAAIRNGHLVVRLAENGKTTLEINAGNLTEHLEQAAEEARQAESKEDFRKGLGATLYFDRALREPYDGKPFTQEIERIGEVQLYLFRDPKDNETPQRWAKMRSPRILVEHSGSTLLNHYAAVLLCDNPEGNAFLAKMEDPKHEKWDEDEARNWSQEQKKGGAKVRKAIQKFVRETLKKVRGEESGPAQDIPFLGRYLPAEDDAPADEGSAATTQTGEATEEETGHRITKKVPITSGKATKTSRTTAVDKPKPGTKKKKQLGGDGDDGGSGEGKRSDGDGSGSTGKPPGDRAGDITPSKVGFRSFAKGGAYIVVLHAKADVTGNLHLRSVGEDASRYDQGIRSARDVASGAELNCRGAVIEGVSLKKGETRRLEVVFASDIKLCLTLGS